MDWITEIAYDLTPRIDIDNPDSEAYHPSIRFARWTGPLRLGMTGSAEEVQRLVRPFVATLEDEEGAFTLIIDTVEGRIWIDGCGCRQSPIRYLDIKQTWDGALTFQKEVDMGKIIITVVGGAVQGIVADPELIDYEVEIRDYDTDGIDPEALEKDAEGVEFRKIEAPLD